MRSLEVHRSFRPPRFLRNPHLQSILATVGARRSRGDGDDPADTQISRNVVVRCDERTRVVAIHTAASDPDASKGVVILLHGWEGSASSPYLVRMAGSLHRAGFETFRVNLPDHGGTHELNPDIFHSCRLDEMVFAVKEILRLSRGGPAYLVGFSLGGNFCLRIALVAQAHDIALEHVVAVCPVIDPEHCLRAIERAPFFYRQRFLKRWTQSLRAKERAFPDRYRLDPLGPPDLRQRTDLLLKRFTDFAGIDEYHDAFSVARQRLAGLSVPTTVVAAADDPLCPVGDLHEIEAPDCLEIEVQRWGGHCGFIENPAGRSWLERRIVRLLDRPRATAAREAG
ncbi:MAG: alpha/beta fold hydrolase [Acidobacteria bacterium]|nr:alpha/beta fold hydrolase [Acidobacteriota bacterium]NIM61728.1 alpha/beta fold hydrolase [Acidobacteriota bacterium]NIO58908.1 alpha/beta fold hydrolase [Acidobacteriota bacterium]NIQ29962.1 alpha/beta fold hydrolase [Acidobacteriota bacterium]NIQ84695.1 alpha/beta fold hydrolase [Acidobacteriota bacterium]